MKRNNKGFTLIELLAAVVILGILVVFSVPIITGLLDNSRSKMYITDTKKLISLAEYKVNASSSTIEKPDEGDCILISMLYLDSADFDNPPNEGEYLPENSYVVVKNSGGKLEYSATIVEKVKRGGYKGVSLVRESELSGSTAKNHVVVFTDDDILNVETDVNRGFINEKLGKNYISVDNSITAIYNQPDLVDPSSSSVSPTVPRIVYASLLSSSSKSFNSLDATLQIRADDKDTPRKDLKIYLNIGDGYTEDGSGIPYGNNDTFSYDINFADYGKTYDGSSIKIYVVVKDPQGNKTQKTITYKIHKNEKPEIDPTSEITRRDVDVYHGKGLNMVKSKLRFIATDDIDDPSDLQVCFKESSTNESYEECDAYFNYHDFFDEEGIMEYEFTNCPGGCKRSSIREETHYVTVFVKDTLGGVAKRKFAYTFSKNEPPKLLTLDFTPRSERYAPETGSKTLFVKITASDDVDDTTLGNGLSYIVTNGVDTRPCVYDYLNPTATCQFDMGHVYDGSTLNIQAIVHDTEGGQSNVLTKSYTLYLNKDPVIKSFSIRSKEDPCINEDLCNTTTGGNKEVVVNIRVEDDVNYDGYGLYACLSLDSEKCTDNNWVSYLDYANHRTNYTIPSAYNGSTRTVYVHVQDSDNGTDSTFTEPYTLYTNSKPKIDNVSFKTNPNRKPATGSLYTIFNINARDDVNGASKIRLKVVEDGVVRVNDVKLSDYNGDVSYKMAGTHDGKTRHLQITVTDEEGLTDSIEKTYKVSQGTEPGIDSFRIYSGGMPCNNEDYCDENSGSYEVKYTVKAHDDIDNNDELMICASEDSTACDREYIPYSEYIDEETDKANKIAFTFNHDEHPYDGSEKTLYLFVKDTDDNIVSDSVKYTLYKNKAPVITEDPTVTSTTEGVHFPNIIYTIDAEDDIDSELSIKYCYEKTGGDYCTAYETLDGPKTLDSSFFNIVRPTGQTFSIYSVIKDSYGATTTSEKRTYKVYTDSDPSIYQGSIIFGKRLYIKGTSEVETLDGIEDPTGYQEYTRLTIKFSVDDPYDKYRICISTNSSNCSNYLKKQYTANNCSGSSCANRTTYEITHTIPGFINDGDNFQLYLFVMDSYDVVSTKTLYDEVYHECDDYDEEHGKYTYELVEGSNAITTSNCNGMCYSYNTATGTSHNYFGTYKTTIKYVDRFNSGIVCNNDNPIIENRKQYCDFVECFKVNGNYNRNAIGTRLYTDENPWTTLVNGKVYQCTGHYTWYITSYEANAEKISRTASAAGICKEALEDGVYDYDSNASNPWIRVDD